MSVDPVLRDFRLALQASHVASGPGVTSLLARALARVTELERSSSDESASFFRQLGVDLLRLRGNANAKARLECLFRVCAYLWQYGDPTSALPVAKHLLELARATNNPPMLRKAYLAFGAIHAELGDPGLSIEAYLKSLELAEELEDGVGLCCAWNNLSAHFIDAGLFGEAIACASQCVRVADGFHLADSDMARRARNNIVQARYSLGDQAGALRLASQLVADAIEPAIASEATGRVILERNLILALISAGELGQAKRRAEYLQQLVKRFSSPRQQVVVSMVTGLIEVISGNPEKGIETLEQTASLARTRHKIAIPDALSVLARAYIEVENWDRALEVTRQLIRYLENTYVDSSVAKFRALYDALSDLSGGEALSRAQLRKTEAELHAKVLQRELARSRQEMLERMAVAADIREDISGEHGYRVGRLSALLAKEIGWDRDSCNALDIAARLHDIGKIGIPERILLDDKTLKEAEKHFIASHTLVGAEILSKSDIPQVRIAEEIARCHHEWWDGSGYPKKMQGVAIPKGARIVALADVFDAMTHGRPYAKAIPIDKALDEIASLRGRQFDPELTDHFLALVRRLARENEDLDAYLGKAARNSPFLKARAKIKEMLAQGRDSAALSIEPPPPGTPLN